MIKVIFLSNQSFRIFKIICFSYLPVAWLKVMECKKNAIYSKHIKNFYQNFEKMNLLYLLLLFTSSVFLAPVPTEIYSNLKILIEPDVYIFHWNYTKVDLTGEIHVKTNGWVAFGLTPNGGMDGSDVFVSWLDTNGKANFTDRYIRQRSVLIDKQQDWELISASISDEYTIVKFRRDIQTCDTNDEDLVIEEGTPRVLYAFGLSSPLAGRDISYHGSTNRGSKVVQLLTALKDKQIITHEDKIKTFDFTVNATIPSNLDTLYYCEMFKLPDEIISRKHHLLKVETLPPLNDDKSLFHHWIVYQCDSRYEKLYLANNPAPEAGNCFNEEWTKLAQICVQITLAWAVGGELVTEFPNGLGFPLGGSDAEFKYFKFQIHYNNPDLATIRDQSGIRFYLTENLRKTEIGIFTIGATSTWNGISIPPKAQNFKLEYSCRMDCTNELYNGTGVTVFAVAPHTHLVGAQVYTKIIRNGREIGYVQKTKNYDFNYQYLNFLNNPVVLKPNDEIKTTCIYNTASRLNFTFVRTPSPYLPHLIAKTTYYFAFKGGISTYDEMW